MALFWSSLQQPLGLAHMPRRELVRFLSDIRAGSLGVGIELDINKTDFIRFIRWLVERSLETRGREVPPQRLQGWHYFYCFVSDGCSVISQVMPEQQIPALPPSQRPRHGQDEEGDLELSAREPVPGGTDSGMDIMMENKCGAEPTEAHLQPVAPPAPTMTQL